MSTIRESAIVVVAVEPAPWATESTTAAFESCTWKISAEVEPPPFTTNPFALASVEVAMTTRDAISGKLVVLPMTTREEVAEAISAW